MANNYLQFSFAIALRSKKEEEWVRSTLEQAENEDEPICSFELDSGSNGISLILFSEESADPERVAFFLQKYLRHFKLKQAIGFEWATWCSVMRLDEFGGGACVVTATKTYWMNTSTWREEKIAQLTKKTGKARKSKKRPGGS